MSTRQRRSSSRSRAPIRQVEAEETRGKSTPTVRPTTKMSAWMNSSIRNWLIALRPWSFPASIVPIALTGALMYREPSPIDGGVTMNLYTLNYVLCFVIVLSLHAAANLTNTFYDFKNGVDTAKDADDRALVDNTVTPDTVFCTAMGCFLVGLGSAAKLATTAPTQTGYVALSGALLAFFYTANPLSLKGMGLGDVIIFLCFGPLLMSGVSMACCGVIHESVQYYSVPIGLLTVDIVHINNMRDVDADKRAGLKTVAMFLGIRGSYVYHCLLQFVSYGMIIHKASADDNLMLYIVLLCGPWGLYTTRRAKRGLFHELPQRVAQHNLMFGTLVVCALSERLFFGRLMLACLYYLGGVNNIIMWTYNIELVHMKWANIFPFSPKWLSKIMFFAAIVLQLIPSILFILGFETKLMAQILLLFICPITFIVHDLWTIENENPAHEFQNSDNVVSRAVPIFPTEFDNEFVHFFKNVGMIGGLAVFLMIEGKHLTQGDLLQDGWYHHVFD